MSDLIKVSPEAIEFPAENVALRKPPCAEDKDYDTYLNLKDDIRRRGLQNAFSVREENGVYFVVDGSRRATAVKELFVEEGLFADGVPVMLQEMDEWDALGAMISGNYNAKKTLSGQEITAINRMVQVKDMPLSEVAALCGLTEPYLAKILKIKVLSEPARAALDKGAMTVTNAIQLTNLPEHIRDEIVVGKDGAEDKTWVEKACTESGEKFTAAVSERINEDRKERAAARQGVEPTFVPTKKMISKEEIAIMLERAVSAFEDEDSDYNRGCKDTMEKIFSLDEQTIAQKKADWEAKQADNEAKKEERKAKREAKKIEDAKKILAEAEAAQAAM